MRAIRHIGSAVALLLGIAVGARAAEPDPGVGPAAAGVEDVRVALDCGLGWGTAADGTRQARVLNLRLQIVDGRWDWSVFSGNEGGEPRYGRVVTQERRGEGWELGVRMRFEPDRWQCDRRHGRMGATGEYRLSVRREAARLTGTWIGVHDGVELKGELEGEIEPLPPAIPGFVPPEIGERPRFLLRRAEIPALRQKAKTPWGRAMLERLAAEHESRSNMAAGQGLLYVLTGDERHARIAQRLLEEDLAAGRWTPANPPVHGCAHTVIEAAIAYDLIHEACAPAFRRRMQALFAENAPAFFHAVFIPRASSRTVSNWSGQFRSAAGVMALSVLADAAPEAEPPRKPEMPHLAPPADFSLGKGVPVVRLACGGRPTEWVYAGPFPSGGDLDPLAGLGGEARARPEAGTKAAVPASDGTSRVERVFAPLDPKHLLREDPRGFRRGKVPSPPSQAGMVDLLAAAGAPMSLSYLYTVAEIGTAGCYRVVLSEKHEHLLDHPCVYVAGLRCLNRDLLRLEAGRYPVLVRAPILNIAPGRGHDRERILFYLEFAALPEAEAQEELARRTRLYEWDMEEWKWMRGRTAEHPMGRYWLAWARHPMESWIREGMGDHGWNNEGEGYTQKTLRAVLPFAHAYRNTFGRDLAGVPNLNLALPLYTARSILGERPRMPAYATGGGPLGVDNYARGFGLVPSRLRPAVLWSWNRTQALADAGKFKSPYLLWDTLDPLSAAFRFVNYPLDVEERNPAELMPLVTVDRQKGGHVFRDRWQDDDDCVATIFLNRRAGGSWASSETGDFRLCGLGVDWVVQGRGWGIGTHGGAAGDMNVLTGAVGNYLGGHAKETFEATAPDGSGIVSMDLTEPYGGKTKVMRSFAVDYSGACGAPCLVAVADRVAEPTGTNLWQLMTEPEHRFAPGGDGFTLHAANGASLRCVVAWPAKAEIAGREVRCQQELNYHHGHAGFQFPRRRITVAGSGFFLTVMTVQKGEPPPASVRGEGESAVVTIGKQNIRFDGEKIVFGPGPERLAVANENRRSE